jgi:hypothetical protein
VTQRWEDSPGTEEIIETDEEGKEFVAPAKPPHNEQRSATHKSDAEFGCRRSIAISTSRKRSVLAKTRIEYLVEIASDGAIIKSSPAPSEGARIYHSCRSYDH